MRVFAAVPLSPEARVLVSDVRDHLARREWPVRWVRDEAIHLTVRFFGEVADGMIGPLGHALAQSLSGMRPMALHLGQLGVFPSRRRARVIWIGVDAPPAFELVHHHVERAAQVVGLPMDHSIYRPHVTLGRVRRGAELPAAALDALDEISETGTTMAEQVVLYRSELHPGGARYEALRVVPLEGAWAV
jgi:2'-5' RNA ligase